MPKAETVDAYIAAAPEAARPVMEALRALITATVPGAEERIAWNVPFYRYRGDLCGFAVYTAHVTFGVDRFPPAEREQLEADGYGTGKKTLKIRFDQPVPAAAIERILLAQARSNEAAASAS
ncbi:MAG: DUF1801 domain-containing protein [Thermoleophilia bacterium]